MAAQQQQKSKGNPASKRMGNEKLKARRVSCWVNGQARKKARRTEQEKRAKFNTQLRENHLPTAWEKAKEVRRTSPGRAAARARWAAEQKKS